MQKRYTRPMRRALWLGVLLCACAPRAPLPIEGLAPDSWQVTSLEQEGLSAEQIAALEAAVTDGVYPSIDGLVIVRHGHLAYERYWHGYTANTLHDLRSASKSITSALGGLAISRGVISLDAGVLATFAVTSDDERKRRMTFEHVLTMSSGLDCDDWVPSSPGNEENMLPSADWARFALELPMAHEPGTHASYCTAAVALAGEMISKATGQPLEQFADDALFTPLGIVAKQWGRTGQGTVDAGGRLWLRPRDFAKFAQAVLRREVIPSEWVEFSLTARHHLGDSEYGALWWLNTFTIQGTAVPVSFARGNGGQYAFMLPTLDMVVVFTGNDYNGKGSTAPLEMLAKFVIPH